MGFGSLDKDGKISADSFRKALQKITDALKTTHCKEICISLGDISVCDKDAEWQARQISEILITSQYRSDSLKSKPAEVSFALSKVTLGFNKAQISAATKGIKLGQSALLNFIRIAFICLLLKRIGNGCLFIKTKHNRTNHKNG